MPRKGKSAKSVNSAKALKMELDKNRETKAALEAKQVLAMNERNGWEHKHGQMKQVYHSMVHTPDCLHETCSHIIEKGNLTTEKNEVTFPSICKSREQFDGLSKLNDSNVNYEHSSHGIQDGLDMLKNDNVNYEHRSHGIQDGLDMLKNGNVNYEHRSHGIQDGLDMLQNSNANYEHSSRGIQDNVDAKLAGRGVMGNNKLSQDQELPRSNNSPDQELPVHNYSSYDHSSSEEHVHHNCKIILAGQQDPDFSASSNECRQTSSIKRETDHNLANLSGDSVVRQDADYQGDCLLNNNNNNNEQMTNDCMKANANEVLEPLGNTEAVDRREQTHLMKNTKSPRKRTLSSGEKQSPRRFGRKINEHQSCTIRSTENINLSAALKIGIVTNKENTNKSCNNTQVNSQDDTQANQPGENSSASKPNRRDPLTDHDASKENVSRQNERIEEIGSTINVTSDEAETGFDNLQPNRLIKAVTEKDYIKQVKSIKEINSNTDNNTKQYSITTAGNVKQNDSTRSNNLKDGNVSKDLIYVDCATEATSKTVLSRKDKDQIQCSSAVAESAVIVNSQNNKDVPSIGSAEGKQYQTVSIECTSLNEKEHALVHGAGEVVLIKTDHVNNTNVPAFDNNNEE